ncbi:hypothetical protein WA026_017079 [Henosepilachna vigintioctopunctata]|uniref:Laminin EGF-like domain-containing protein n=1 Tax=Henosepilachna vigintioctopunctata TaxID=420089 RepID=A0AAW1TPL7_9CUCU
MITVIPATSIYYSKASVLRCIRRILSDQDSPCSCDPEGSLFDTCNSKGQCMCKPNYKGPKCKRCKTGFWKHPQFGCIDCLCNRDGSISPNCDAENGKCTCKSGVGGDNCNACLPKYYGNITEGCQKCDPCDEEGHICDPNNGKCVCPPLTIGYTCEKCSMNSWGYTAGIGCKNCSCSITGSVKSQCDINSGNCECKKGYEGEKCNSCSFGYYGYPNCKQCTCNPSGTLDSELVNGIIRCDENGRCRCKENVEGRKCDTCKPGTFGLDRSNPEGCKTCFCFGRSSSCTAVDYTWDQIHTDKLAQTTENCLFSVPCVNLPIKFTGDLTLSYGGFLRIISASASAEYFVRLTGNNVTIESTFRDDVRLDELNWRIFRTSDKLLPDCNRKLNRKCLMVVLQNVSNIVIKTTSAESIGEVMLDKAVMISTAQRTKTIEKCDCPKEYRSLSCQDPNHGYYRSRLPSYDPSQTWVDRIVGVSKKCACNGLSNTCDAQTGHCLNCENFTTGPHCEYCAEGFYRTSNNVCLPCLCPSEKQNFAKNCTANSKINHFICHCKEGYTGKKCNKCADGYFGKPQDPLGSCRKCNCNSHGSVAGNCDKVTGRCQCHPNFTGIRCDQCKAARKYIRNGICTPCDECTQILFNVIDGLSDQLNNTIISFEDGIQGPWKYLDAIEDRYDLLKERFTKTTNNMQTISDSFESLRKYEDKANNLYSALKKKSNQLSNSVERIKNLSNGADKLNSDIGLFRGRLNKFIADINRFGISHLNLKNSLEKAKQLLKNMDSKAKTMKRVEDYFMLFHKCDEIFKSVQNIYKSNDLDTSDITKYVNDLKMRFEDLKNLSNFVRKEAKQIKLKNKENFIKYHDINKTISVLKNRYKMIMDNMEYSKKKLNKASELIEGITKFLDEIVDSDLDSYFKILEDRDTKYNKNAAIIEQKLRNIKEHATFLDEMLKNLKRQMNFTKEEWKKISAGESYENIVKVYQKLKKMH